MAKLRREAGIIGLLFASLGSIVGSGWLFGSFNAAQQAGALSIYSWGIAAVAVMTLALVYAELTTMFPKSGALIHISHITHGTLVGQIWSWILFLAYVSVPPIEVMAILTYANNYLPGFLDPTTHTLTTQGFLSAIVLLGIVVLSNFFAIRFVLLINNTITWWKLAIPLLTIVILLTYSFHPSNLHVGTHSGVNGMFTSIATAGVVFSFLGFRSSIDLAGETKNPSRNIPIAVIGSIIISALLYMGLQYAFLVSVPPSALSHGWANIHFVGTAGPLAAIAALIGAFWWAVVLYVDAFVSPLGTGYIYTTTAARITMAAGETGSAPKGVSKLNRHGVPWVSLLLIFVVGSTFFFPFPSWHKLVGYVSSITVLSYGLGPIILLQLRRCVPKVDRPFRLKLAWIIAPCAFFFSNAIIFWTGYATVTFMFSLILVFFVIYLLWEYFVRHVATEAFGWAYTWWLIPYFVGMWVISRLGPVNMGGDGIFSFWESLGMIALLSALIIAFALKSGLSRQHVLDYMEHIKSLQPE